MRLNGSTPRRAHVLKNQGTDGTPVRDGTARARAVLIAVALAAVALAAAGCGGGGSSASLPGSAQISKAATAGGGSSRPVLTVSAFQFADITVAPGATIQLVDNDDEPHTVTADDKSFDSTSFDKASPGSLVAPNKPGRYPFHCEVHPSMRGTLTVR